MINRFSKYVILDRDGVINRDDDGYVHKLDDLEFLPGAIEGLAALKTQGFGLIIITNQAGIARGFYGHEEVAKFHGAMLQRLEENKIGISKIYYCPHHPDFSGECHCRKPKTGLAIQAAKDLDFDLAETVFIGDKDSDIEFGKNAGGKTILIRSELKTTATPHLTVNSLLDAAKTLEKGML